MQRFGNLFQLNSICLHKNKHFIKYYLNSQDIQIFNISRFCPWIFLLSWQQMEIYLPKWLFNLSWCLSWLVSLYWFEKMSLTKICRTSLWNQYKIVNHVIIDATYQSVNRSHIWQGTRQWTFCPRLSSIDYQGCNNRSLCIYLRTSCTMACLFFRHRYFVGLVVLKQKYYKEMKTKAYMMVVLGIKLFIDVLLLLLFIAIQCNVLATCFSWIPFVYTKISTSLNII